jgi:transcriptional regulator with XRE-family HTH domain
MGLRLRISSGQQSVEDRIDEELSSLIAQVTNEINWHMREHGLTRADLAGRLGVSPGRVSQILSGGENLTLRTLAGLAGALDGQFEIGFGPYEPATGAADVSDDLSEAEDAPLDDYAAQLGSSLEEARVTAAPTRS